MPFQRQKILPAAKKMKDLEQIIDSDYEYVIMLDCHISQLQNIVKLAKANKKKIFLHADLIQGLKNDEYATEFLCQDIKPEGVISTRASVIMKAKQRGIIAIQRVFLLDTNALDKSYKLIEKTQPDFIEVLPGIMPHMITEVYNHTGIPIVAGGLIRTAEDVNRAIKAGATAVTTSRKDLWGHFL